MARKKSKAKPAARRRAKTVKRASGKRRAPVQAGFAGALTEIAKGVLGAVIATKIGPMIPVADARVKYGIITAAGGLLAVKGGNMRSIGVGMGIAGGTLLAGEFFPNLLNPAPAPGPMIGRVSPALQARMEAAAQRIRTGINGNRGRTIVGTGEGDDFPQPVNGYRQRTIVGSGDPDMSY